jgi:glycosyltransferase involved in cell wall biosynthesis
MRIIVTANHVPFIHGGADFHVQGVVDSLRAHGHEVELLRIPFRFQPESEIERLMAFCEETRLDKPNGRTVDRVVSLQFPAYGVQHPEHVVWVMHQHRAVYELDGDQAQTAEHVALREAVRAWDDRVLARASRLYANSRTVADRLSRFNGLAATPLYHPPFGEADFFCDDALDYLFCPSRLENLKRQELVIRAAAHVRSPVAVLIGGEGGQADRYRRLVDDLGLAHRVRLIGRFSEAEKRVLYARCLGVLFVPRDEDYGYVTLEAMLSAKPVITCSDSGGPLEFVEDGSNGLVSDPEPEALAAAIDRLYEDRHRARDMGEQGRADYARHDISWHNVVARLLA